MTVRLPWEMINIPLSLSLIGAGLEAGLSLVAAIFSRHLFGNGSYDQ
jgi:hypothetical protein